MGGYRLVLRDRAFIHLALTNVAIIAVGGTVASPAAGGQLRLADARYENFATGAVLTNIAADLVGDRDRFSLTSFSGSDGAGGTVKAGVVELQGDHRDAALAHFAAIGRRAKRMGG